MCFVEHFGMYPELLLQKWQLGALGLKVGHGLGSEGSGCVVAPLFAEGVQLEPLLVVWALSESLVKTSTVVFAKSLA